MRLEELTSGLSVVATDARTARPELPDTALETEISGLAYDSRAVGPGELFFCISGFERDGHEFAPEAVARGAAALVVERRLGLGVPEALAPDARAAMGPIAGRFFRDPSADLRVVGITGTNGKTTTAYLVRALLEASGTRCGLLGTVTSIVGGEGRLLARTTPEAIDLQGDFREMLDHGDRACAMEVSSHALELGRIDGTRFAVALFTNLTRDHLDFHETMEDYYLAKRRLFLGPRRPRPADGGSASSLEDAPGVSIINRSDPYGHRLAAELSGARTFAVESPADYAATAVRYGLEGCTFTVTAPTWERAVTLPMAGRFNVANALGALAAACELGADADACVAALERGVRVPGRLEGVDEGQDFAVLVDYAHTPDSLENVLGAARELVHAGDGADGRVLCVFGAGGDRDRGKRPLMGEVVARMADVAIVTSDNPRSEDPERILAEIVAGIEPHPHAKLHRIVDRRAAIEQAIELARPGDVVLIAGKGHEQGQELAGGLKTPFDDVTVAREALGSRAPA